MSQLTPLGVQDIQDLEANQWLEDRRKLIEIWATAWGLEQAWVEQILKKDQLEVIRLLLKKEDVVLTAKTGFGKSLIFHSLSLLRPGSVTIIVCPLDALESDQEAHINSLPGAKAFVLNRENSKINSNFTDIAEGKYTHILVSPEILTGDRFREMVWMEESFLDRLSLIAIDEMHVIEQWGGGFRIAYGSLHSLRVFTQHRGIPWFGTSATLDPETFRICQNRAGFADISRLKFIRTPIDRPDIAINIQPFTFGSTNYKDLKFLIKPKGVYISKTIIYCDEIRWGSKMVNQLRQWLVDNGHTKQQAKRLIKAYNSEIDQDEKERIATEFKKNDSTHRIIVATDALGMGVNNPDIALVIQWGIPKGSSPLSSLWQRAGRAARGAGVVGEFIFFFDRDSQGPLCDDLDITDLNDENKVKEAVKRSQLPRPLHKLLNCGRSVCYRRVWLEHFLDKPEPDSAKHPRGCCNHCSHISTTECDKFDFVDPELKDTYQAPVPGLVTKLKERLNQWASDKGKERYQNTLAAWAAPNLFLDKETVNRLSKRAGTVVASQHPDILDEKMTGWDPNWLAEYRKELFDLIHQVAADMKTDRSNKPPPRKTKNKRHNQHSSSAMDAEVAHQSQHSSGVTVQQSYTESANNQDPLPEPRPAEPVVSQPIMPSDIALESEIRSTLSLPPLVDLPTNRIVGGRSMRRKREESEMDEYIRSRKELNNPNPRKRSRSD